MIGTYYNITCLLNTHGVSTLNTNETTFKYEYDILCFVNDFLENIKYSNMTFKSYESDKIVFVCLNFSFFFWFIHVIRDFVHTVMSIK